MAFSPSHTLNFSGFFLLRPPFSCLSLGSGVPCIILVPRFSLFNYSLVENLRVCMLNVVNSSQCGSPEVRRVRLSEALHLIPLFVLSLGTAWQFPSLETVFPLLFISCCFGAFEGDEGNKERSTLFNQNCSSFYGLETFQHGTRHKNWEIWHLLFMKVNVIERKKIIFLSLLHPSILIFFYVNQKYLPQSL